MKRTDRWTRERVVDLLLWALAAAECASSTGARALNAGGRPRESDVGVLRTSSVLWVDPPEGDPDPLQVTTVYRHGHVDRQTLRVARDWVRSRGLVEQVPTRFTVEGGGRMTVDAITRKGVDAMYRSLLGQADPYAG